MSIQLDNDPIDPSMLPTLEQDEAAKRALKFFVDNPLSEKEKTGLYFDPLSNRMFVNLFLISDSNHKKPWKVNGDYIANWIPTARNSPIVLFKKDSGHFDHPLIKNASIEDNSAFQETKSVGRTIREFLDPRVKGAWRGLGEILVPKVKQFLKELNTKEVPIYTSPQIHYSASEDDYNITKAVYMHSALTDMPSFPPEVSNIRAVCEGDALACYHKIANATINQLEAGESQKYCYVDAMREILNKSKNNTYLKIDSATSQSVKKMSDQKYATGSDTDQSTATNTNTNKDNSAVKVIDLQTAEQLTKKFVEDAFNRNQQQLNEKADPVKTFEKAYGIKKKGSDEPEPDDDDQGDRDKDERRRKEEDPGAQAKGKLDNITAKRIADLEAQNEALAHKERIAAIKDVIPLQLVLDPKTNTIDPAILKEQIELWDKSKLSPEDIAKHYAKEMKRMEILVQTSARRTAKASISEDELADFIQEREGTKFQAPNNKIGNASATDEDEDNEVIKNASASGANNLSQLWYLDFANAVVTPVTNRKTEETGAPRRMID
jgi:hypothetical protein